MATSNVNTPYGLKPINMNGTPWSGQLTMYHIPSSVSTNIFVGDPMTLNGSGDAYGVQSVILGTAAGTSGGSFYIGPVVAVCNGPAAGANATAPITRDLSIYHPASTAGYVLIADDPNTLFAVQEDSVGNNIAATDLSSNFSMIAGTGSTASGFSGWALDSSTSATTTLQLRLLRLIRFPGNGYGAYGQYIVRINQHCLWNTTGI